MSTRTQSGSPDRDDVIVESLTDAFAALMEADAAAFRHKFRTMASDPHAFYRGSACLFYADVTDADDPYADGRSGRIWIHGDLHVENFGTYLNADGRLVFDVNDFDEAYLGHFTWDLQRFAASLALTGGRRRSRRRTSAVCCASTSRPTSPRSTTTATPTSMTSRCTWTTPTDRCSRPWWPPVSGPGPSSWTRCPSASTASGCSARTTTCAARPSESASGSSRRTRTTSRPSRSRSAGTGTCSTTCATSSARAGSASESAGLPAYNFLIEGVSQALDNDVVLSMKQANVPAISRFVDSGAVEAYFDNEGHRTVVSQRALQVHTDPMLGYTELDGVGYVVSEVSPYEVDLDWAASPTPTTSSRSWGCSGGPPPRSTAPRTRTATRTSSTSRSRRRSSLGGDRREELVAWVSDFGIGYADQVRRDHTLFVDAFREGRIGIAAT